MIFFISSESSYEIPTPQTINLQNQLNKYFESKNYGELFNKISTIVICVSEKFETLHPVRSSKISKSQLTFGFEYKLDFQKYKKMNSEEQERYIVLKFEKNIREILTTKKVKNFDSENFLKELKTFLIENWRIE